LSKLLGDAISEETLKATLAHVHSVLAPLGEGSTLIYKVHHKSFPDYITGPSCLPEFQVSEEEHHLHLTKYCLQVMNMQLKFNICQVPEPSQYKDLADLVKEGLTTDCISAELKYAVFFWANHLGKIKEFDSELKSLLDEFAKKHVIHWLEVLAYTEQLDQAYQALREALAVSVCQFLCSIVLY
jgi:hypothetical protein